jgi:hypothetical protein
VKREPSRRHQTNCGDEVTEKGRLPQVPARWKLSRFQSKRRVVRNFVEGSLVLFKIYLCLESQFFLLLCAVTCTSFSQPEQNTRLVWSH